MPRRVTEIVGEERYDYYPLGNYIVRAKGVCGGKPTFKYTRIEVSGTLSRIAAGETIESIVKGYCGRVSREAIAEAIQLEAKLGKKLNKSLPGRKSLKRAAA